MHLSLLIFLLLNLYTPVTSISLSFQFLTCFPSFARSFILPFDSPSLTYTLFAFLHSSLPFFRIPTCITESESYLSVLESLMVRTLDYKAEGSGIKKPNREEICGEIPASLAPLGS